MDEMQALVQSIGEMTVSCVGQDNLSGLEVTLNAREHSAFVMISLSDSDDEVQREAVRQMLDVEKIFDELSVTWVFVDALPAADPAHQAPRYVYA